MICARWMNVVSASVIFVSAATLGCGGDPLGRHAISGSVSVAGAPLEAGNISFQPTEGATTAGGATVTAGKYSVARKDGLPKGKYRVAINAPVPGTGGQAAANAPPGDPIPPPKELIPPDWNTQSEHFIEVTDKGPYVFDFEVKDKAK
jgi:hypothetical protein